MATAEAATGTIEAGDVEDYNRAYQPYGAAKDLIYCKDEEVLIEGPAGTGKSRACLEKAFILAEKYPGARILFVRKTRESMTESVLEIWEDKVVPPGHPIISGPMRRIRQAYHFPNGSSIVIGGLDKSAKIMSTEYDLVIAFEATELTEDDWEKLTTRIRNHVIPYQQGICDCNPDQPRHWLNLRANSSRMARFLSKHEDNPSIDEAYLERLRALTGIRRDRLYLGKWAVAEGAVYPDWDPTGVHLIDRFEIPESWRRIRAIDFGYTNPFNCQWWAADEDDRLFMYREIYRTQRLVEDHARDILELSGSEAIETTVADWDAEDRATLERHGVPTFKAYKGITTGIEAVQARLRLAGDGRARLFIFRDALVSRDPLLVETKKPTCTSDEIPAYTYQEAKEGKPVKEEPMKVADHGCDTMRYLVAFVDGIQYGQLDVHATGSRQKPKIAPDLTKKDFAATDLDQNNPLRAPKVFRNEPVDEPLLTPKDTMWEGHWSDSGGSYDRSRRA